jgi:predicted AAA+ superfamily ATPase
MIKRILNIPIQSKYSFFLWGPRQIGKSSLLKKLFPNALYIDLLLSENFIEYSTYPSKLREKIIALKTKPALVIIDEIQKIPALLDEVHYLIENENIRFGLCGSSARKLKRNHANLLGGRAVRYELYGLVSKELDFKIDLPRLINHGQIPRHYLEDSPNLLLRSYVSDYLKEEIAAEGLVRNLPKFARFLEVAAIGDTQILNYTKIAEDCGVSAITVKDYYSILEDTIVGSYLYAYAKAKKRKLVQAPKFYMFDTGVVRSLSKRTNIVLGTIESGPALENYLHHEIKAYSRYSEKYFDISYWKLLEKNNIEVDFILGDMEIAVECKTTTNVAGSHLKSLYELGRECPKVKRKIIVCLERNRRIINNQGSISERIEVIPISEFLEELWNGDII